jgi:hypothetical protein
MVLAYQLGRFIVRSLTDLNTYSLTSVNYTDQGTGSEVLADRYQINGIIDTSDNVMTNIEKLCSAGGSWLSYDIHQGKWGVVINKSDTSIASFDDSNIIGSISISGTGIQDLYNNVKAEFPHRDIKDTLDFISIEIPDIDRNDNEPDNILNLTYDLVNEPIQAELLAFIELKQSRVDLIINFRTDFTKINLNAGDVIDVTNSRFNFTSKLFRIISISELQNDDGALQTEITALEYDSDVYDESNLYRYTRSDTNGIITIGSIGVPGTPQVTKYERDARPRILVESTSPTGVVEGMEFWLSNDVGEVESNRSYRLIATRRPAGGGVFTSGTEVELDYDALGESDFVIKTRGFNSTTVGSYSSPSGLIEFVPEQVTDAIGPNTTAIDSTGNLLTTLAVTALLNNLDKLLDLGDSSAGGIFDKIFQVFEDVTGYDLVGQATGGNLVVPASISVKDEGANVTTSTSSINFTGDGVLVTGAASAATVTINGVTTNSLINSGVIPQAVSGVGGFLRGELFPCLFGSGTYAGAYDTRQGIFTHTKLMFATGTAIGSVPNSTTSGTRSASVNMLNAGSTGSGTHRFASKYKWRIAAKTGSSPYTYWITSDVTEPLISISTIARSSNQATIVTSSPHGITGFGRVSIFCESDTSFNTTYTSVTVLTSTSFRYSNLGNTVTTISATGKTIAHPQFPASTALTSNPRWTGASVLDNRDPKIFYSTCTYNDTLTLEQQSWSNWTELGSVAIKYLAPDGSDYKVDIEGYTAALACTATTNPNFNDRSFTVTIPENGIIAFGITLYDMSTSIPPGTIVFSGNTILARRSNDVVTNYSFPGYTPISGQTASLQYNLINTGNSVLPSYTISSLVDDSGQISDIFESTDNLTVGNVWPDDFQTPASAGPNSANLFVAPLTPELFAFYGCPEISVVV